MSKTKLTKKQIARYAEVVTEFKKYGYDTGPIDEDKTKSLLKQLYKNFNLAEPEYFFRMKDPLEGIIAASICFQMAPLDTKKLKLKKKSAAKWDGQYEDIFNRLMSQIDWSVTGIDTSGDFFDRLKSNIVTETADELLNYHTQATFGSLDSGKVSMYDFAYNDLGLKEIEPVMPLVELAKHSGLCYIYPNFVIMIDKPSEIHMINDSGKENRIFDNDINVAFGYSTGFGAWWIEGVEVTEQIVMRPETLSIDQIKAETNAEASRIMKDRYGWKKYFEQTKSEVIDTDFVKVFNSEVVSVQDGAENETVMPRMLIKDESGELYLVGTDGSTHRSYTMPLGKASDQEAPKTCKQAHELICGLDESKCIAQS